MKPATYGEDAVKGGLVRCPVCDLRQSSYMALALHMMRGEVDFIGHSSYIQDLTRTPYAEFVRKGGHIKKLAVLLEKQLPSA